MVELFVVRQGYNTNVHWPFLFLGLEIHLSIDLTIQSCISSPAHTSFFLPSSWPGSEPWTSDVHFSLITFWTSTLFKCVISMVQGLSRTASPSTWTGIVRVVTTLASLIHSCSPTFNCISWHLGDVTCTEQSNGQCHQLAAMEVGKLSTQSPGGYFLSKGSGKP